MLVLEELVVVVPVTVVLVVDVLVCVVVVLVVVVAVVVVVVVTVVVVTVGDTLTNWFNDRNPVSTPELSSTLADLPVDEKEAISPNQVLYLPLSTMTVLPTSSLASNAVVVVVADVVVDVADVVVVVNDAAPQVCAQTNAMAGCWQLYQSPTSHVTLYWRKRISSWSTS